MSDQDLLQDSAKKERIISLASVAIFTGSLGLTIFLKLRRKPLPFKPSKDVTTVESPFNLAIKAFGYGTALCLSTAFITGYGVSRYLGVNSLKEFAVKIKATSDKVNEYGKQNVPSLNLPQEQRADGAPSEEEQEKQLIEMFSSSAED
jgi:hypothetical protein